LTPRRLLYLVALLLQLGSFPLSAATFRGTVTNKTHNKPSPGDTVTLVNVQAGMSDATSTATNSAGEYSLNAPGVGPYLIRVSHQGATYFIAAPEGGASGDVGVYDVAPKVDGVAIDVDMLLIEAGGGVLRVQERYLVRNTSLPPRAQFSSNTFEIALPPEAELDGASATRPGGMGTITRPVAVGTKGHYTFNVPIQPNQGEKETLFEVQYHLPYNGRYTFTPQLQLPADNLVVYVAPGIKFSGAEGAEFRRTHEDPRVETYVAKSIHPGQSLRFTVAGEGQMARDAQGNGMGAQGGAGDTGAADASARPGGGIGAPIGTPDPLTRYKWWILTGLALLLVAGAALLPRTRGAAVAHQTAPVAPSATEPTVRLPPGKTQVEAQSTCVNVLLTAIKEELFAIEREKLTGTISHDEYATIKAGLEAMLRRELARTKRS
jgi:hypothetical protein